MPPPPLALSVDKVASPPRSRSPFISTPKSAIIAIPASWADSPGGGSSGRASMDDDRAGVSSSVEPPFPMSASSSSSSSNPIFAWPQPTASSSSNTTPPVSYTLSAQDRPDPFDTTSSFADDPFGQASSSSEDGSRHNSFSADNGDPRIRRPSVLTGHPTFRHPTDPIINDHPAIDPELDMEHQDEYNFQETHPVPPTFHRTFSSPLPNRVKSLRHPLSPSLDPIGSYCAHPPTFSSLGVQVPPSPSTAPSSSPVTPLQTLSLELADSLQSAIQTLLHLSPPHLLDNAKEQYSGCTVQMPSTSLSALLTSMRGLNYLSANVEALCEGLSKKSEDGLLSGLTGRTQEDFDIGELLQSVADLLGGQAAQGGVDFVLFHGDVGIKHVTVRGDGEGLGYALSHIIRQILLVANKGDTIELGLQIIPQSPSMTPKLALPRSSADIERQMKRTEDDESSPGRIPSPSHGSEGPLLCSFEIVHNIYQQSDSLAETPKAELNPFTRLNEDKEAATPKFDSLLTRRLLQHQNANLRVDVQPSSPMGSGFPRRAYEFSVLLPRGTPLVEPTQLSVEEEAIRQPFSTVKLAREPTLAELSDFAESLRGRKVFLHASLQSVFARHLTSYLGAWGMDISHIPIEEDEQYPQRYAEPLAIPVPSNGSPAKGVDKFVIIDDDVSVLKQELLRLRVESPTSSFRPRLAKRPTLAGRTRSTPLIRQSTSSAPSRPNVILIHFTSLANYNHVRDVVSNFLGSPLFAGGGSFVHPEVMVIPKPVGPRRFLTALHTAVNQPVVDPFFSPIATSPRSPGGGYFPASRTPTGAEIGPGGFFDSVVEEQEELVETIKPRSPLGEYPPAQASIVRTEAGLHLSLPTPGDILATPASEYFSTATRSSGGSGAAGVVMQSPDGRPFGMFFEPPRGDNLRRTSFRSPSDAGRRKTSRRTSAASTAPDENNTTSPNSPQSSRRTSGVSTVTDDGSTGSSRRGSGLRTNETTSTTPTMASNIPPVARTNSRRKTLPISTPSEPIIAKGRDRSSTVTRRPGAPSVPIISTPRPAEDNDVAPPLNPPRGSKKTAVDAVTEAQVSKSGKKAGKEEVVVPPINVLIVEDNPINQNILSMFLRKKKIKHQSAKDGLEAVEKWRTGGFHLILMDIQLPVMDGIEATKEIRKLEKNNNIGIFPSTPALEQTRLLAADSPAPASPFRSSVIIVALTASSLQSDRVSALAAGCNDFLTKPVSLKWLERKIVEWGCMQALIDFDGWRRWKSSDTKDPGETKRGFQVGPQQAAKTLAGRLKIERKPPVRAPTRSDSLPGPEINLHAPTPEPISERKGQDEADKIVDQLSSMAISDVKAEKATEDSPPVTAIPIPANSAKALPSITEDRESISPELSTGTKLPNISSVVEQVNKPLPSLPPSSP